LNDSIKIPKRYLIANTQALIELKSYKGNIEGWLNDRTRNKDIVIASLEKENQTLRKVDEVNSLLFKAYQKDSTILHGEVNDIRRQLRNEKAKKWGLGVAIPVSLVLGFVLGFYIPKL